ncbi:pre-mRNA-splicing factor SPF27 [Atheta coriaria]|uniref:pre-mRNA-splicing factor SPF27 n=1 Tax=Dalotia coriaria TaxID=877792 RepID=UPI0031F4000A
MAGEVIVDALPYIDQGYDEPGVREAAFALVEEECRRYRPTKNYLDILPPLNVTAFETSMMHAEFERLQNRLPMETMSMKRYELPPPPAGKLNEVSAWYECVENSHAQLEHQAVRILNLQLMLEYCCPAWQRYLESLQDCERIASKKLTALKQSLQEVNWQRKSLQTKGGEQLRNLEAKWVALVSHNYEIEQACCLAEEYLAQLKEYERNQLQNAPENQPEPPEEAAQVETEEMSVPQEDTQENVENMQEDTQEINDKQVEDDEGSNESSGSDQGHQPEAEQHESNEEANESD